MIYIKNKTNDTLNVPSLGIILVVGEIRDISEFSTRNDLELQASRVIEHINAGEIIFADADLNELTKVESMQYTMNVYNKVSFSTTAPLMTTTVQAEQRFYYVQDKNLRLNKGKVYTKTFLGDLHSLNIFTSRTDIKIRISMNGLHFPEEHIYKNQSFNFRFDGLATDVSIELETGKYSKDISIYMDGKSSSDIVDLQTFINNWSL